MVVQQGNVTFLLSERSRQKRVGSLAEDDINQSEANRLQPNQGKLGDQKKGQPGGNQSEFGDQSGSGQNANQQERVVPPTIQGESKGKKRGHAKSKVYPWLSPLCKLPVDTLFNVCLEVN